MTCAKKKRQYHRYYHESPVMIYTKELPDSSYYGRTYNSSQGGMYLETDADLEIGKFYVVKIIRQYDDARGPEPYEEHCGSVRWIHTNEAEKTSNSNYLYGYGLSYT